MSNWSVEDDKLVTLAKGARARVSASSGAALRDTTGRTYANASVTTNFLNLSAIKLTVAQAIASGATGIEAIVLCSDDEITTQDREIVHSFSGVNTPIYLVNNQGERQN